MSDLTKDTWEEVFHKGIYEFFNLVAFSREYNKRQQEALEQWKQSH